MSSVLWRRRQPMPVGDCRGLNCIPITARIGLPELTAWSQSMVAPPLQVDFTSSVVGHDQHIHFGQIIIAANPLSHSALSLCQKLNFKNMAERRPGGPIVCWPNSIAKI